MKKRSGLVNVFETFGRSFLLPVSVLPAAGILKGIGSAFTNSSTIEMHPWMANQTLQIIMGFITMIGSVAFDNLPVIFAVGVVVGLAKQEKGSAALSGLLGFLVLHNTLHYLLSVSGQLVDKAAKNGEELMSLHMQTNVLGIQTMDLNVFGGIITGIVVYLVHKKAIKMQVPQVFGFFSGPRLVPILTIPAMALVALGFFFIWPYVQVGITALSFAILKSGYFGTFAYGVIERLLLPFGLHHGLNWPVRTTELGGIFTIDGHQYAGTINAYMAALQSKLPIDPMITRFSSGKFVYNMFGLPGAALAMYMAAKPEKKKMVGSLLLAAALTSFLTSITEPLEFTFLFVAPALYGVHAVLVGITMVITNMAGAAFLTPTGHGLINYLIYGVLQGPRTHWWWLFILGVPCFIMYFLVFSFVIKKFNFKTPGREDDEETVALHGKDEVRAKLGVKTQKDRDQKNNMPPIHEHALALIEAHGGEENISAVDACITRLRINVKDEDLVEKDRIVNQLKAMGFTKSGMQMQSIYGGYANQLKIEIQSILGLGE
ncbi:PTS transporter subunit EIIC [Lactococcus raffinolactis]|uniref:PTS transporter subunit EIIC n=1 Tax=Pseudolactococcus raffinolactis TaxID=1366 RepID=UPI001436C417|nr:PTS transporter subunit EIIC [Lactococcus raffinolactis]QIW50959.1 PTS transporter subunit EIIC [Lactococcus raffinolactis]